MSYLKATGLWEDTRLNYNFGNLVPKKVIADKKSEDIIELNTFISSEWQKLISVASSDDLMHEALKGISSRTYGQLIHKILSEINTVDDISSTILHLTTSGLFSNNDIKIIQSTIESVVTHPKLEKYFQTGLIIKNETEVMLQNGEIVRPDRVVIDTDLLTIIDYKTGDEKKDDDDQLEKYRKAFSGLGYKTIETKLVYIADIIRIVETDNRANSSKLE